MSIFGAIVGFFTAKAIYDGSTNRATVVDNDYYDKKANDFLAAQKAAKKRLWTEYYHKKCDKKQFVEEDECDDILLALALIK